MTNSLRASIPAWLLLAAFAGGPALTVTARAQGTVPAVTPDEIDGQINGKRARFVASGDDVLLAAAEADRLGVAYLDGKRVTIGGTPLWIVTLAAVTVAGKTRLAATAGVVPSIAGYFAALRTNPAEAVARSREIQVDIGGRMVTAYDLGTAGVLMAPDVAESAGLNYRAGKRQDLGAVVAWLVEPPSRPLPGTGDKPATVIVAEPLAYLRALIAGAGKPP
ncbi:MAG: hypothetical protein ABI281_01735 [Caldimonas sp.]